ncbi:hypothetical protein HDU99_005533, partial [Rhizoclosmatium hyalinum]
LESGRNPSVLPCLCSRLELDRSLLPHFWKQLWVQKTLHGPVRTSFTWLLGCVSSAALSSTLFLVHMYQRRCVQLLTS